MGTAGAQQKANPGAVAPSPAGAGHGEAAKPYDPKEFTGEERERIEKLFSRVICDCPRENWSKTLAGCPDTCADPQKKEIRQAVKRGLSEEEVLSKQLEIHGGDRRVLAIPDSPLASFFPYLALAALTAIVILVLYGSVRHRSGAAPGKAAEVRESPAGKRTAPREAGAASEEDRRIAEAVERDLQEMD